VEYPAFEDGPDRGSETSAKHNLTPGKYPKEHMQYLKYGESFKSITLLRCSAQVHIAEVSGQNIGPTFMPLKIGPAICPETSARNYHYSLCNNTEERSSQLCDISLGLLI
jgi:hypothetical protein